MTSIVRGGKGRNQCHWEPNTCRFYHKGYLIHISRLLGQVRGKFTIKEWMITQRNIIVRQWRMVDARWWRGLRACTVHRLKRQGTRSPPTTLIIRDLMHAIHRHIKHW